MKQRDINLFTGLAVLAVIGVIIVVAGVVPLLRPTPEPPKTFIAYIDESGGLRAGDAVRIKGRRAGYVSDVSLANRDGRIVTRVEFVIRPGTGSPWLNDIVAAGIPTDSTVRVRQARMLGRPRLDITVGSSTATIAEGGEWQNSRGAGGDDEFTGWKQDIDRAREQIAQFTEFVDDRELFGNLNRMLIEAAATMADIEKSIESNQGLGANLADSLDSATRSMTDAAESLRRAREGDKPADEPIRRAADGIANISTQLATLDERINEIDAEIVRLERTSGDALSATDRDKLAGLGVSLRRQSARLRSSMVTASGNPKKFGDMPGWRWTRPYYHGGKPPVGTSIDDDPPPAPADGAGVPGGRARR